MIQLKMKEDYCCGGGHCGPLPGYEFDCPVCEKNSGCRTGVPLKEGDLFKCLSCKGKFEVHQILDDSIFEVSIKEEAKAETDSV